VNRRLELLIVLALILSTGCGDGTPVVDETLQMQLRGTVLIPFGPDYPTPMTLVVSGHALWAGSMDDVHAYDRRSGLHAVTIGKTGDGPGELRWLRSLQSYEDRRGTRSVWAFDRRHKRLTGYMVEDDGMRVVSDSLVSDLSPRYQMVFWANDTTLVGFPIFSSDRFDVLDPEGHVRRRIGKLPQI